MIFQKSTARSFTGMAIALTMTGWGCLSMQSQTSIDGNTVTASTAPYVEGYVEYPGPQLKWSGPSSFILHVNAKDSGPAQIAMTPELVVDRDNEKAKPEAPIPHDAPTMGSTRVPASKAAVAKPMSSEEAREQLSHLAMAIQGTAAPFQGCMSPVRVRLVRSDGGLIEKQGCRSEKGWSRAVSETVNVFISASVHGYNAATSVNTHRDTAKAAEPARNVAAVVENRK